MAEKALCETVIELFKYYINNLQPVYNYLVVLKDKKPIQAVVEIENTFSHLAQACKEADEKSPNNQKVNSNLKRARNHLNRLETDLYKLLLVELKRRLDIEQINNKEVVQLAKVARDIELAEIGAVDEGHRRIVDAYRMAVNKAIELLELPPLFRD
jgi:hypothetical protein